MKIVQGKYTYLKLGTVLLLYIITIIFLLVPQSLYAELYNDSSYEEIVMPELFTASVLIDDNDELPIEPNISEVEFLRLPNLNGISDRVDRLIQGVSKAVPPEYDHYGHEIRRYMVGIGNLKIYKDEEYLKDQIKNVRKAGVIADFWWKHVEKEIKEIEGIIDTDEGVAFSVRSAFKQNNITTKTFFISLNAWIDTNERVLMHLFKGHGMYSVMYPEILVHDSKERRDFYNYYLIKQTKLKEIVAYRPFEMMSY